MMMTWFLKDQKETVTISFMKPCLLINPLFSVFFYFFIQAKYWREVFLHICHTVHVLLGKFDDVRAMCSKTTFTSKPCGR